MRRSPLTDNYIRPLIAVAKKELKIFLSYPTWTIMITAFPILFTYKFLLIGKLFSGTLETSSRNFTALTGTDNYVGYIVIGASVWILIVNVMWNVGFSLRHEQMHGTLEQSWVTPTPRIILLLGRTLSGLITNTAIIGIMYLFTELVFGLNLKGSIPSALLILIILLVSLYGVGIIFGAIVLLFKESQRLIMVFNSLALMLCGVMYPSRVLPDRVTRITRHIPFTRAIDNIRRILIFDESITTMLPDLLAMAVWGAVLFAVGYLVFIKVENISRRTGTFGSY